jgi:hypothetical protein
LEDFKGLQKITFVNNNAQKPRLTSVRDGDDDVKYDRQEIVDVFAEFYETLYARRATEEWQAL